MGVINRIWSLLGPGILLAATSVGASHLVLSPRAGMLFGPTLLWLVLAAHVLKYPAFEFGPRYALATGDSLLTGYARVPGPRRWALVVFALFTTLQGVGVAVAVTSITAAVLVVSVGYLSLAGWGTVVATVSLILLVVGRFSAMEVINKLMMATLAVVTVVAFMARPAPPSAWTYMVLPTLPEGAIVLAAAMVGWLPTGIDVSVWHSLWALKVRARWDRAGAREASTDEASTDEAARKRARLRSGLLDMRAGYGLSFVLALCFLVLGMYVSGVLGGGVVSMWKSQGLPHAAAAPPDGANVAVAISHAYGTVLGRWIIPAFLITAFFGMFSTTYVVMDGFPRALAETLRLLSPTRRDDPTFWSAPYWALLGVVWLSVVLILWLWPKPVALITAAALMSLAVSPLYYALNYYCVTRHVKDPTLAPGRPLRALALAGILFVFAASVVCVYFMVGKILG
jgi:Mn2+/Fe2+ NRAMP family transporter